MLKNWHKSREDGNCGHKPVGDAAIHKMDQNGGIAWRVLLTIMFEFGKPKFIHPNSLDSEKNLANQSFFIIF